MNEIADKGILGIVVAGLAWFVMYLMKSHKEEREDQRRSQERRDEKITDALNSLKDVIKTIK